MIPVQGPSPITPAPRGARQKSSLPSMRSSASTLFKVAGLLPKFFTALGDAYFNLIERQVMRDLKRQEKGATGRPPMHPGIRLSGNDPYLMDALNAISTDEKTARMLDEITGTGGPIRFCVGHTPFEGSWDSTNRVITINPSLLGKGSESELMATLFFELANASQAKDILALQEQAQEGSISMEDYVRSLEAIEYRSSCEQAQIINDCIAANIFPDFKLKNARAWTASFELYYLMQQFYNHSQPYAKQYKRMHPLKGHGQSFQGINAATSLSKKDRKQLEKSGIISTIWDLNHGSDVERVAAKEDVEQAILKQRGIAQRPGHPKIRAAAQRQLNFLQAVMRVHEAQLAL